LGNCQGNYNAIFEGDSEWESRAPRGNRREVPGGKDQELSGKSPNREGASPAREKTGILLNR